MKKAPAEGGGEERREEDGEIAEKGQSAVV